MKLVRFGAIGKEKPGLMEAAPRSVEKISELENVLIPRDGSTTDGEVELGVVIGKEARYLDSPEDAAACVLGIASRTMSRSAPFNWNTVGNGQRVKAVTRSVL